MTRVTRVTSTTRMTEVTGMTRVTKKPRMTRVTWTTRIPDLIGSGDEHCVTTLKMAV